LRKLYKDFYEVTFENYDTVYIQENKTETKEILRLGFIFLDTYCINLKRKIENV